MVKLDGVNKMVVGKWMRGTLENLNEEIAVEVSVKLPSVQTIRDLTKEVVVSERMVTVVRVRDWLSCGVAQACVMMKREIVVRL